jgi:AraC-like DNA-binding protein
MKQLCASGESRGSGFRLQLLQVFMDLFDAELQKESVGPESGSDAKERLLKFLQEVPASELLHIKFSEIVQMTRCTPRHLSRIFREVVGMSFRDKHAELRLHRACELLANSESKVVDVALESGYQSLSLFNQMFARRFGMSPGKWRQKRRNLRHNRNLPAFQSRLLARR